MRCLTLANELKKNGYRCLFIVRPHPGCLASAIAKQGHQVSSLSSPDIDFSKSDDDVAHRTWLGAKWEDDARETIQALAGTRPEWLVVDHYAIDYRWQKLLRRFVNSIFVIDDLADRNFDCDCLLDQTYGRKEADYRHLINENCRLLLGSQYALLRPEFAKLRMKAIQKRREYTGVRYILVSIGGTDSGNATAIVLKGLAEVDWNARPIIDVVLNRQSAHLQSVISQAEVHPLEVNVLVDVDNMANLMLDADLAIGAAGSTSWEYCCMGLPALVVVTAENQLEVAKQLALIGAVKLLNIENAIKDEIGLIIKNDKEWIRMSHVSLLIANGFGCARVLIDMCPSMANDNKPIRLRQVSYEDVDLLYSWQIDPLIRRYSHTLKSPSYNEHCTWLKKQLNNVTSITEVIIHDEVPAGLLRFDLAEDLHNVSYVISIYIEPDKYKLGLAKGAIKMLINSIPFSQLIAEVRSDNNASHALFKSLGFDKVNNETYMMRSSKMAEL